MYGNIEVNKVIRVLTQARLKAERACVNKVMHDLHTPIPGAKEGLRPDLAATCTICQEIKTDD